MTTSSDILQELSKHGSAQTRKIYQRHGAPEAMFGVKVADMKKIAKKIKGEQQLALDLYATGNSDAMYLAGMVADGSKMTKKQLDTWAKEAGWYMIAEYTVPGVACESPHAHSLATKWMKSRTPTIASCGWATYCGILATQDDKELDLAEIKDLLKRIPEEIDSAKDRVRYTMNGFVIAVGSYVKPLLKQAKATAKKLGKVEVNMGETSCKVPLATDYIKKIEDKGYVGKKRKTVKC